MAFRNRVRAVFGAAVLFASAAAQAQPAVTINTTLVDFGEVALGSSGLVFAVPLRNTGTTTLTINNIVSSGDFAVASTSLTCEIVRTIAANGTCVINIRFVPSAPGTRNGVVSITSDAPGSPHSFNVTGVGIVLPAFNVAPAALTFGTQAVGSSSAAQTLSLTNPGTTRTLDAGSVIITGDFTQTNNCPLVLAPLASCQFNVTFSPKATGARSGLLTLACAGECGLANRVIALQGIGIVAGTQGGVAAIPTLGQWALVGLSIVLGLGAMTFLRRWKA